MQYLLLAIVILLNTAQSIVAKQYGLVARKSNTFFFSAISSFVAMIFFMFGIGFRFDYRPAVLGYSVAFGVCYAAAIGGNFLAIKNGPLALSTLVMSYSLVIPTVYGIVAQKEKLSPLGAVGVVCLCISLVLINELKGKDDAGDETRNETAARSNSAVSIKWLIYVLISFFGNGICATVQKVQPVVFDGRYKNEFMIVGLLVSGVLFMILSLADKENLRESTFPCVGFGALKGAANGISNMIVIVLVTMIPGTILYPTVSAGAVVFGFILAITIYKERLSKKQLVGYAFGIIAVILLNM